MNNSKSRVRITRDPASGVEVIQASFRGHAYDLHHHDDWLVGITDSGVQEFSCRGTRWRSTPGRIILIEPGEVHDGEAGSGEGFSYRMLYLPQAWLKASISEGRAINLGFRSTLCADSRLGEAIGRACHVLAHVPEALERSAALDDVLVLLRRHLNCPPPSPGSGKHPQIARWAREMLHDRWCENLAADVLAMEAGAKNRFHLARAFRAEFGTSPHAYAIQIKLKRARAMLCVGEKPASVAALCGFADQSHLGRNFRRAYGLTPAAYRGFCTNVLDSPLELR